MPDSVTFESVNYPGHFLRHQDYRLKLHQNDGSDLFRQDATFLRQPYSCRGVFCQVRFKSSNFPGHFIRHSNYELWIAQDDGSELFRLDSTWRRVPPPFRTAPAGLISFQSSNYPDRYIRHRNSLGEISPIVSDLDRAEFGVLRAPSAKWFTHRGKSEISKLSRTFPAASGLSGKTPCL